MELPELLFLVIAALLGALIGGFLNVVIWRGPALWGLVDVAGASRGNFFSPRSYCPSCRATIPAKHNVPLLSYFLLGGQCAECQVPIGTRYFLVEVLGAAAGILAVVAFGPTLTALVGAIFLWVLIALAAIDHETGYLPDALTLPLIGTGFTANAFGIFVPPLAAILGAVGGYAAFLLLALAYQALRKREGLGRGDAKLLAALGAWLGWEALPLTVLVASGTALLWLLVQSLAGRPLSGETSVRFGPALGIAGAVIFLTQHLG